MAFWHSTPYRAQVKGKELCLGFGGGALKSDGFQHLWAPGRETLEFWEPSLPWGKMLCLLSPALPLPCWALHA